MPSRKNDHLATKTRKPGRTLTTLAVLTVLGFVLLIIGHFSAGATFTPKLALDLEGGTQLILTPRLQEGTEGREVSQEDMTEAINIIRQRIDASGVAEAEISTLGSDNIVVAIPGEADESILALVRSSATMRFRPVLVASGAPGVSVDPADSEALEAAVAELVALAGDSTTPSSNSDYAWITPEIAEEFLLLDCTSPEAMTQDELDDAEAPSVSCDVDGAGKYLLGPVDIEGTHLKSATAGSEATSSGKPTGKYAINLELDAEGTKLFAEASKRLYDFKDTDATRNRFAVVLDGNTLIAPSMNAAILDGHAQVTGNFSAAEAQNLANQVQFGSLPLNFEVQSEQQISATLGSNHLEKGLWAGLIGLALVVLYMIWQYRGLAALSAGSLLVAGIIVYLVITILSWTMGYRLSLPGVAGLIVAVGITADSFIVYFERIRDEVREGRPLAAAVADGWDRAKRTIMISDAVNLVAAIVLYVLAVGGVQGFAFTLGITTVVDLVVVFMFTHPMLELLIRTRFFGEGHRLSGLDPEHLGAASAFVYQGRGRVTSRKESKASEQRGSTKKDRKEARQPVLAQGGEYEQLPLAERRRLARLAAQEESAQDDSKQPEQQDGKEVDRG